MHDWTLSKVDFDWKLARVVLELKNSASAVRPISADGVAELYIPRKNDWGPSASVNEVFEVEELSSGLQQLEIEMQSGDVIKIVAARFVFPADD